MRISRTLEIDDQALTLSYKRASGPGGQNVNKLETAVELRLDVANSGLPEEVQHRLQHLAGRRLLADGFILINAQEHRTQEMNRRSVFTKLRELALQAAIRPRKRIATKPTRASKTRRLDGKAHTGRVKALRRVSAKAED